MLKSEEVGVGSDQIFFRKEGSLSAQLDAGRGALNGDSLGAGSVAGGHQMQQKPAIVGTAKVA